MSEIVKPFAEWCAAGVEAVGIAVIAMATIYSLVHALTMLVRRASEDAFQQVRQRLGRGILLGLEYLVAADIIESVAVDLSFRSVGVLAIIVLVRTFLSFTLEVELTGKWPWQERKEG